MRRGRFARGAFGGGLTLFCCFGVIGGYTSLSRSFQFRVRVKLHSRARGIACYSVRKYVRLRVCDCLGISDFEYQLQSQRTCCGGRDLARTISAYLKPIKLPACHPKDSTSRQQHLRHLLQLRLYPRNSVKHLQNGRQDGSRCR